MAKPQVYDASAIQALKGLEPVRRMPGMYTHTVHPLHIVQEAPDNAVDEALAGFGKKIAVSVRKDGSVEVTDEGRGVPVDMHPVEKKPAVEVAFTMLHAGGKFSRSGDGVYHISGGLHGVGVAVSNALSKRCEVTVFREGQKHTIAFEGGELKNKLKSTFGWDDATAYARIGISHQLLYPRCFVDPDYHAETLLHFLQRTDMETFDACIPFGDDLRQGHTPVMDARFGREVLEVTCAAYWSAGDGGAPPAVASLTRDATSAPPVTVRSAGRTSYDLEVDAATEDVSLGVVGVGHDRLRVEAMRDLTKQRYVLTHRCGKDHQVRVRDARRGFTAARDRAAGQRMGEHRLTVDAKDANGRPPFTNAKSDRAADQAQADDGDRLKWRLVQGGHWSTPDSQLPTPKTKSG